MSDKINPIVTKFHNFLAKHEAKEAWDEGRKTGLKRTWTNTRFYSMAPKDWIVDAFDWASSANGLSYWNTLHNQWQLELRN